MADNKVLTVDFRAKDLDSKDITYTVERISGAAQRGVQKYLVTKFHDDGTPIGEYTVSLPASGNLEDRGLFCDCQGFRRQKYPKPQHKHVKLVAEHVRQGEPRGRVYTLDKDNNPVVAFEFDPNAFDPGD